MAYKKIGRHKLTDQRRAAGSHAPSVLVVMRISSGPGSAPLDSACAGDKAPPSGCLPTPQQ